MSQSSKRKREERQRRKKEKKERRAKATQVNNRHNHESNGSNQQRNPEPNPAIPQPSASVTPLPSSLEHVERTISPQPADETNPNERPSRTVVIERAFAAALVVFAGAQATVAFFQFNAMRAQNDIASEQLKAMNEQLRQAEAILVFDQRPWLVVHAPQLAPFVAGQQVQCIVPVNNIGKTPAHVSGGRIVASLMPKEIAPTGIALVPSGYTNAVIAPGEDYRIAPGDLPVVTQNDLDGLKDGTLVLDIVVELYYSDFAGSTTLATRRHFFLDPNTGILKHHTNGNYMR